MNTTYEPKVDVIDKAALPDEWTGAPLECPPGSFVVSRHANGSVASVYRQLSWNWSAYTHNGRSSFLNFKFWVGDEIGDVREGLIAEIKWILFLLVWKRQGATLSYSSLKHYVILLRSIARFCEEKKIHIHDVLSDYKYLFEYIEHESSSIRASSHLSSLFFHLCKMGISEVGYSVAGIDTIKELRVISAEYTASLKQHPPIPTRIYSHIITTLNNEITDFESVIDRYFELVTKCIKDPLLGKDKYYQPKIAERLGIECGDERISFQELLIDSDLDDYFTNKLITKHSGGLSRGLYNMQTAIRLLIHVYSGMRDEEVAALPYDCIEYAKNNGKTHYIIKGTTTKFNKGKTKKTRWITSREGHRAILIAKKIADLIYTVAQNKYSVDISKKEGLPLFVSTVYLGFVGHVSFNASKELMPTKLDLGTSPILRGKLQPTITVQDLAELEQIDPHRAWSSEDKFKVGSPWVITTHQLRRALALYAQRSGLVSLPSLRRQLQHITEEMSRYYARGSSFAKNFIGDDKNHFGVEWQDAQPVSAGLSYIMNVLMSDDVLFGGHANWVDHRLKDKNGVVIVDRVATMRRFQKGELSYRETIIGGCTNVENCDQITIKWLDVDCIGGCRNLVGRLSKLERVVIAQTKLVDSLDQTSMEYRNEKSDLDVLIATRDKARQQSMEAK